MDNEVHIAGELKPWPDKSEMASILRAAGLSISVGTYSIRLDDCDHFVFQEFDSGLGDPTVDADAESLEAMLRDASMVSDALVAANIRHRFEIYDSGNQMTGYVHHNWPL